MDAINYDTSRPQTIAALVKLAKKYNNIVKRYWVQGMVAKTLVSPYPLGPDHVLSKYAEDAADRNDFRFHYGVRCQCRDFCTAFRSDYFIYTTYLRGFSCQASGGQRMGQGTLECLMHAGRRRRVQVPSIPDRGQEYLAPWLHLHQRRNHHRSPVSGRYRADKRDRVLRGSQRRTVMQRT